MQNIALITRMQLAFELKNFFQFSYFHFVVWLYHFLWLLDCNLAFFIIFCYNKADSIFSAKSFLTLMYWNYSRTESIITIPHLPFLPNNKFKCLLLLFQKHSKWFHFIESLEALCVFLSRSFNYFVAEYLFSSIFSYFSDQSHS